MNCYYFWWSQRQSRCQPRCAAEALGRYTLPAGNLQRLWRAEKSHDGFNIREKRRVQQWGVISFGASSVAKPYEPYLPFHLARIGWPISSRIELERIGIYLVAITASSIHSASTLGARHGRSTASYITLNIGPTTRRRKIHQCQGYDVGHRILLHLWGLSGSETHTHNHEMMD
jgi:hypothetical protein